MTANTIALAPAAVAIAHLDRVGFEHLVRGERDEFGPLHTGDLFTSPATTTRRERNDRGRFTSRRSQLAYDAAFAA